MLNELYVSVNAVVVATSNALSLKNCVSQCMMKNRIIFCSAISLALLAVILLALLSPVSHRKQSKQAKKPPWADLSLYIQQPHSKENARSNNMQPVQPDSGVFVFRRALTEGPENTSQIVGKAQGFIIPNEQFARSSFNIIYLSFDTLEYSGSLSVHAKHIGHEKKEEMAVVGGTGSFAFAQGIAVFLQTEKQASVIDTSYHLKLQLQFPK